jgi:hypothetical protein
MVRNGRVFGDVEFDGGFGSSVGIGDLMALVHRLVITRELVCVSDVSARYMEACCRDTYI